MRLSIAFVTPKMIVGGAEQYIIAKSDWLIKQGHSVIVLSEGGGYVVNLPVGVRHYVIRNISSPPYAVSSKEMNRIVDQISEIILTESITVVEAHNTWPIYYTTLSSARTGVPYLYNLLNELSHRRNILTANLVKQFSRMGMYYTLTDKMNRYVERHIHSKLNPRIIPIPVVPLPEFPDEIADYILSVCRFSSDKMYVVHLMEGFAKAYTEKTIPTGMKLKIVGDGELNDEVRRVADACNRMIGKEVIELPGQVTGEALFRLYHNCYAYAGMGTTMLQAAQYAKPIIKVGFEPSTQPWAWGFWGETPEKDKNELVADDPDLSERVPFHEILSWLTDKKRVVHWGRKAFETYHNYYDYEAIMKKWEAEYQNTARIDRPMNKATLNILNAQTRLLRLAKKLYNSTKR
jgi:glycosyltransferase involved in cell wall biosynthesis